MKITLTRVEYSPRLSQETNAFAAIVNVDGVPVFEVTNEGHGGSDDHHPLKGQTYEQMHAKIDEIEAYAKTLPNEPKYNLVMDMDLLIGDAFEEWLTTRDLKKLLRSRIVWTKADGKIYSVVIKKEWPKEKILSAKTYYRANSGVVDFLDEIPFEKALEIYRKSAA